MGACSSTQLTPQQEWVMSKFAECKTITNAVNVKLEQVWPDGRWTATVMQTQSEYNHLVACMRDESVSATLYRRQADTGNAAAMAHLGRMYEDGRGGLTRDDAEAIHCYRRGAAWGTCTGTGDRFAMYFMGRACEFGLGVTKDRAEAVQWYRKAAEPGFTPAAERLKTLGE